MSVYTDYLTKEDVDPGLKRMVNCPECGRAVPCDEDECPDCGAYIDYTKTGDDSEDIYDVDEEDLGVDTSDAEEDEEFFWDVEDGYDISDEYEEEDSEDEDEGDSDEEYDKEEEY